MDTERPIVDLDYIRYEAINFDLDQPAPPPHFIYHFTRQRRKPQMEIQAVDRLGFCAALITKGAAVFEHLGQPVPLRQGSVFLRRQNVPYRFYKTDPDELELIMIMFDPSIAPIWNRLIRPDCIAVQLCNRVKIIEQVDGFFELLSRNPERRIERANAFAPLFLEMITAEELQTSGRLAPETERVERCRHYIHENFRRIRHMDEAARACRISRNHLYTLFRQHLQTTPKEYLDQFKTGAATELLTQTDWTMERIAEETGYTDAATFSKAFKRRNGVSPAQWRRGATAFAH
jgi:AraC-like DNA-binding protein